MYVTWQSSQILHPKPIFSTRVSPPIRQKESITSGGSITKFERGKHVPHIHSNSCYTSLLSVPSRLSKKDEIIWLESFYKWNRIVQHLFYTSEIKIVRLICFSTTCGLNANLNTPYLTEIILED